MTSNMNRFLFTRILKHFPSDITFAFAYGSGVFHQDGNANPNNMIDLVFAVDKTKDWHAENMERNPVHYSGLRFMGPSVITAFQEKIGAGVYYNTLVHCEKRLIKYGVVQVDSLTEDLNKWNHLYISGRLHKPVNIIRRDNNKSLSAALQTNLRSALTTALLLLPESFSEEQLFHTIAGLSYHGDFRMTFGENKNKVHNIVKPNLKHFQEYYRGFLEEEDHLHWDKDKGIYQQETSSACIFSHLQRLPSHLQHLMIKNGDNRGGDLEEMLKRISEDKNQAKMVNEALQKIVEKSSRSQSLKAIPAAGVVKTVKYSSQKLMKMWKSTSNNR
ncbi:phosphatidate cytidylyltransferase, mitochondrial-like isoform X2 [Apostichopus japonicus]|uniref:phosphatidate cytidylyltransferase, mitochondrial-like isoform X2 n=1 Tax=Stichopus japonicus TaxID=307972 RepID=UPI003AB8299F